MTSAPVRVPERAGRTRGGRKPGGGIAAAVCATVLFLVSPVPASAQNYDNPDIDAMPGDGEGKWIVQSWCSACHSLNIVKQQGMSRHRWDETLIWMVEKQGMPEMPDDARETVLDYLAEYFGEDHRPGDATGLPLSTLPLSTGVGLQPLFPPQ